MFRPGTPEAPRSDRTNALLAGYLAFVAGFVNSGGYVLIGSFTSHVTGSVGRMGNDVATGRGDAALFAGLLVLFFFAGAVGANLLIDAPRLGAPGRAYGGALAAESALLLLFIFVAGPMAGRYWETTARIRDAEAALLCLAMGMQNSLFTRMSGAVIRTTHLTGVVTDLGIETARWINWVRGARTAEKPALVKTLLLSTIFVAFTAGALLGAVATLRWSRWSMLFPSLAIALAALLATNAARARRP